MHRPISRVFIPALTLALACAASRAMAGEPGQTGSSRSIDESAMDKSVPPGEDFFAFANGRWLASAAVSPEQAFSGIGQELSDEARRHVREIVESAAAHPRGQAAELDKVGNMYTAFMDETRIERLGSKPLQPLLRTIGAIHDVDGLASTFATLYRDGVDVPFHVYVHRDLKDARAFSAYLGQSGLGLPGPDFYTDSSERSREIRKRYVVYIDNLLNLAGLSNSSRRAERVLALEARLASVHWSDVENRNVEAHYNPMSRQDLSALAPGIPWSDFLSDAGVASATRVVVAQPSAIRGTAAAMAGVPLEDWRDYLSFHLISSAAQVLPRPFVEADFAFEKKTLRGVTSEPDRPRRGVTLVNTTLGDAVGKQYVASYFPAESRRQAEAMVSLLLRATREVIASSDWMTAATKSHALEKLSKVTVRVGYPDKWTDYGDLSVLPDDAFGNQIRAARFAYQQEISQLRSGQTGNGWWMPPQEANAYANPFANEIVFPAAILQPPLFSESADDAVNFGAIGAIIGHEISHLFDDQGRKFDGSGQLSDWWATEDASNFKSRTAKLVGQYSAYEPIEGLHLDGQLTLSENIADLAGLEIAYRAYHLLPATRKDAGVYALTDDQRFFIAYAQAWRGMVRPEALRSQLKTEAHAPARYRALTVRNIDEWYKAFDIPAQSAMFLPPSRRVRMW